MIARVTPGVPSQVVPAIMASPAGTPGQLTERQQLKMLLDETDPDRPAADEADEDDGGDPRVLFPAHGVGHPCAMLTWCCTSASAATTDTVGTEYCCCCCLLSCFWSCDREC